MLSKSVMYFYKLSHIVVQRRSREHLFAALITLNALDMEFHNGRHNQALNLQLLFVLLGAGFPFASRLRLWNADPLLGSLRGDKDDLPFAGREEIADYEVVLVAIEGDLGFTNEQVWICLQLVRYDHALRSPVFYHSFEEFGHRVSAPPCELGLGPKFEKRGNLQVQGQALRAKDRGRTVKIIEFFLWWRPRSSLEVLPSICRLDFVLRHPFLKRVSIEPGKKTEP